MKILFNYKTVSETRRLKEQIRLGTEVVLAVTDDDYLLINRNK